MQIYYPLSPVLPTLLVKLHVVVMEEQSFGSAGLTIKMAAIKALATHVLNFLRLSAVVHVCVREAKNVEQLATAAKSF